MFSQFIRPLTLFSILLILCSIHIAAIPVHIPVHIRNCSDETDDTTFQNNRAQLLGALQAGANNADGFYITSVNAGQSSQLFGLIMCYIDINWNNCSSCLSFSISDAPSNCPNSRSVILSSNWCFLRYSSVNFTSKFLPPSEFLPNQRPKCLGPKTSRDSITLKSTVHKLLQYIRNETIQSPSRYSYANINDTGNGTVILYAIEQCTRDLSAIDCGLCLQSAIDSIDSCSINKSSAGSYGLGSRVVYIGCYIRYFDFRPTILSKESVALPTWPQASSTPNESRNGAVGSRWWPIVVGISVPCGSVIIAASIWLWSRQKKASISRSDEEAQLRSSLRHFSEFRVFELHTLILATNNFSEENMLGQGGFGPVFKASLGDGKDLAIKRLLAYSKHGLTQLKNELISLAKVKHRNLVQLVGCCIQKKEKLLCYELLPNGSLEKFIFANDPVRQEKLNWKTRYSIIQGISSGLYYLHEKSTVRIVHRDLKPSNILLDTDMTPKISDFGLAKLFKEDQTHLETSNPAGTLGYMAPEYFLHGTYSVKLDVYSFGVLLLEIVTGKSICSFADSDHASSLMSYVHQHATKGEYEVLRDPVLQDVRMEEFRKCIHIGLQCVQEDPDKRPHMKDVEVMLSGYSTALPPLPELRQPLRMSSMISDSSERDNAPAYENKTKFFTAPVLLDGSRQ